MTHRANAYHDLAGIRDVQIRSDHLVTVWLGYESTDDEKLLSNPEHYTISSDDDQDFAAGVHPGSVSRFSRGSRSKNGPFDWTVQIDHLMHLAVDKPFKSGKHYTVSLADGLIPEGHDQSIGFSLDETPNPSFKLNQVGYTNAASVKLVYLSSYLGDGEPVDLSAFKEFSVRREADGTTVLSGAIRPVSDKDPQGNDALYVLDVSGLKEEGAFHVWVEGLGRSYPFLNGEEAARSIYDTIARGLYFQRCGTAIEQPYAEKWPRGMAHDEVWVPKKNIVHPWEPPTGAVDPADPESGDYYCPDGPHEIHGGHYDAGDFDTRLTHYAVSERLMSLYEAFPDRFSDGQTLIPENDNGVPDILDEAAWSLLHLEYLQDYAGELRGLQGAVPPGMESWTHPPKTPEMSPGDKLPYFMRKATPYSTFGGAALFAQAARVFKPFDEARAAKYLHRAKAAYDYAVANADEKWDQSIENTAWEERYDDNSLRTAWAWAAGNLYVTTGQREYWVAFAERCDRPSGVAGKSRWTALWPIVFHAPEGSDPEIVERFRRQLIADADKDADWVEKNAEAGYRALCPTKGDWGRANPVSNIVENLGRGYLLTGDQRYLDAIATSVDFVLGMNPSEMSWMTGAGSVYPMDPLSINSKFDGVEEPLPGIVIFGPGDRWQHHHNILYPEREEMGYYRRFSDVWSYVPVCEYVVDEQQAGMLFAAGVLLPDPGSPE